LDDTLSHASALFGVELCGVEVVSLYGCAEGIDVIALGNGPFANWHIETMDKIDKLAFVDVLE
jgi:hypothetical protein